MHDIVQVLERPCGFERRSVAHGQPRRLLRRAIHFFSYHLILKRRTTRRTRAAGFQLTVRPAVFHPRYFITSEFFASFIGGLDLSGKRVADVGTGSGVLAIAALRLGANTVVAVDADLAVLSSARENLHLNGMQGLLVNGTADCIATAWADVTVANISGTVLLAILEDLRRMTKNGGALILTGFPESEAVVLRNELRTSEIVSRDGWCCLTTGRESFKGS